MSGFYLTLKCFALLGFCVLLTFALGAVRRKGG